MLPSLPSVISKRARNHLKGHDRDRVNAVLTASGYNFSLVRRWFDELLRALRLIFCRAPSALRFA